MHLSRTSAVSCSFSGRCNSGLSLRLTAQLQQEKGRTLVQQQHKQHIGIPIQPLTQETEPAVLRSEPRPSDLPSIFGKVDLTSR